jgi:hypothetical protein
MIMKKYSRLMRVFGVLGALMLPAGIVLALWNKSSAIMTLAGFFSGLGSVLLLYWAFAAIREKRSPGSGAEYEAAQKDERGQLINGKAALAAFFATAVALVALTLYFLFVAQMQLPCLLTSAVLLVQGGVMAAARWYYGKKL